MKRLSYILIIFFACASPKSDVQIKEGSIIISNVNIIDVRDGTVIENQHLLIDDGKITRISDQAFSTSNQVNQIDGSGKYLLPGLAEMHAHIPSPDWGRKNYEETLFLYLSNGVTTIRGMLGHPVHLEMRARAKRNELLSPRIFSSSPSLNGNTVTSIEEARTKVAAYKNDGYDFLKLHPGLKLDVFNEIVKTANEVGIPYAGHVSVDVGIRRALESKYATVDHVDGFLEGLVPESAGVNPSDNGFFGYNFTDLADTSMIGELVSMTVVNKVWVVPTQSLFDRWFSSDSANVFVEAPEMKYMPKSTLESWVNRKNSILSNPDFNAEQQQTFNSIRRQLIYQLQKNGHGLLLGSDAPQVFNVPGFSIHHELKGIVDAGLTTLEAIQSGTINPAIFFNMEGEFGEIVEGASADLILLSANPLDNLDKLRNPDGVMVRGRWLSRSDIDKRLEEISASAAEN